MFYIKEDTISINHNWLNAANINSIHNCLIKALNEVKAEFQDFSIKDLTNDEIETVLQAHHGMNFQGFGNLLSTVSQRRKQGHLKIHSVESCPIFCCGQPLCDDSQHRQSDFEITQKILHELLIPNEVCHHK